MNSIHNNGENDKAQKDKSLIDGLDKLGHAYRQLEQDEPPELLDQAVLSSAHRAVEKKPHWMKIGWLQGLTTAAVFVLAFSIILNQREPLPVLEKTAKKHSAEQQVSENAPMKMEENNKIRQSLLHSRPTATAPKDVAKKAAKGERADQARMETQRSFYVHDELSAETDNDQKDVAAEDLEQKLLAIIMLKKNGDERWKAELESFMDTYPDYPVPDELKVP